MAGLAAALRLSKRTDAITVHEAAGHAGGRCRSFHDELLGHTIDNGNHLLLSGNSSVAEFLSETGAADSLPAATDARLPFVDLETGDRWTIDPNDGRLPWWIFAAGHRVKDSGALDYLAALKLAVARRAWLCSIGSTLTESASHCSTLSRSGALSTYCSRSSISNQRKAASGRARGPCSSS